MSDKYFVDTNILMYTHTTGTSARKHARATALIQELWDSGKGVVSTQVLQELCVNVRKKSADPMSMKDIVEMIRDYEKWEVVQNEVSSVIRALEIEERYKISFWDALILQAAERAGASILYSEDLADGQIYGSVRVVNPLKEPIP